jgi:hypothetical protein
MLWIALEQTQYNVRLANIAEREQIIIISSYEHTKLLRNIVTAIFVNICIRRDRICPLAEDV